MLTYSSMLKTFLFLSTLLFVGSICHAAPNFKPYFGIEFQYDPVRFDKTELGIAKFKKWTPQERLFVGLQVNEYFASEFGYELSARTKEKVRINRAGEVFLGRTTDAVDANDTHQLEYKRRAWNINFIGLYPHLPHNLSLLGSVGFSWVNVAAYDMRLLIDDVMLIPTERTALYTKNRVVPTLGAGLQWLPNTHVGLRCMGIWQNNSRMESLTGRYRDNASDVSATLKNNIKLTAAVLIFI